MSGFTVLIKKQADGSASLSCRRADGSVTWQRQEGATARGELPAQALLAELIVGFLDGERASGTTWSIDELRSSTASYARQSGRALTLELSQEDLERIRARRGRLFAQWAALDPGKTLELTFAAPSGDAARLA